MDEYITKEAAIQVFEWGEADVIEDYGDGCNFGFSRGIIKSAINAIPAADVAPVVHGRWVTHYRSGTPVAEGYVSTCCDMWNNHKRNYCPNCGAKMEGEQP